MGAKNKIPQIDLKIVFKTQLEKLVFKYKENHLKTNVK